MGDRGKEFPLSITIRTVDKATAGIERVNKRLDKLFEPTRNLRKAFGALHENLGLPKMAEGFRGIGGMLKGLATQAGVVAGVAGAAVLGFKHLVDEFDQLGDTADKVGVSVDFLAQLRFAAEDAGSSVEELDSGLASFGKNVGQAKAGTGRLAGFLKKVSPALLKQLKATKSNEEAFDLMAGAMDKVEDPAKRAALAAAAFGGAGIGLAPLLAKGRDGIAELREEFAKGGSLQKAADVAGKLDGEFRRLSVGVLGVKVAILEGLGPAFLKLTDRAKAFFEANRDRIGRWVADFGERLPARLEKLGEVLRGIFEVIKSAVRGLGWMVDKVGGAENAVKLLAGAFVAFKALELAGHLGGIARGLIGIAAAATSARGAVAAVGETTAALAGGEAEGTAAAGAAKAGGAGRLVRSLPFLGAVWAGAEASAGAIDSDQRSRMAAQERGFGVAADLKRFRERGDAVSRRMLAGSLRSGGFLDASGRFADTAENRAALLSGGDSVLGRRRGFLESTGFGEEVPGSGAGRVASVIEELNKLLSEGRAGKPTEGKIKIDITGAPKGTRVTSDSPAKRMVDMALGFQMGGS